MKDGRLNEDADGNLTCAFGSPWMDATPVGCAHCIHCWKETMRGIRAFWKDVADGKYDAQGYTPAERRAQVKRAAARARDGY